MQYCSSKIGKVSLIGIAIASGLSGTSLVSIADEIRIDCRNPNSNVEYKECARREYMAADRQLNNVYQKVSARVKGVEKKRLVEAQTSWLKFRDRNCDFEVYQSRGGTGYGGFLSNCLERMTKTRTQELEAWLNKN